MSDINFLVYSIFEEEEKKSKLPLAAGIGTALGIHHLLGGNPGDNAGIIRKLGGSAAAITAVAGGMGIHRLLSKKKSEEEQSAEKINSGIQQSI